MRTKSSLLGGVAVGVMLAAVAAAPVQAKTVRRAAASETQKQIDELRDELQTLKERLDEQTQINQQAKAQVQAAQADAAAAKADAAQSAAELKTAQAQIIQTIPAEIDTKVNTAVAANKPKPSWADNTQVSGRVYFDFSNINQQSAGTRVAPSGTGFDIKRFYLGVDHKFNDMFSANVTTDFQYSSAIGATELYIKKAYLQAKLNDALVFRLGAADMPWIPFAEDRYGYRYLEQTLTDRTKFGTSSDWGLHALGSFKGTPFSYQISVVNGLGYKTAPGTGAPRPNSLDVEGRVSAATNGFTFALGGYDGKLGKDQVLATGGTAVTHHDATRFNALASYENKQFRVGAEYFSADNWTTVTSVAADAADGWSLFGNYNITDKVSLFGRYDWVRPNKDTSSGKKDQYFNVGISYEPVKIVDLSLVYKRDTLDGCPLTATTCNLSTGNGVIGGTIAGNRSGAYDEFGLFGQYRW
jgi:TolA-binding protein